MYNEGEPIGRTNAPLVSCHADGYLRFWNVREGTLVHEVYCQGNEHAGLSTITSSLSGSILMVGDTAGYVRIFDVSKFRLESFHVNTTNGSMSPRSPLNRPMRVDFSSKCKLKRTWKAHVETISRYDADAARILTNRTEIPSFLVFPT